MDRKQFRGNVQTRGLARHGHQHVSMFRYPPVMRVSDIIRRGNLNGAVSSNVVRHFTSLVI
jgi:hypothetical protein